MLTNKMFIMIKYIVSLIIPLLSVTMVMVSCGVNDNTVEEMSCDFPLYPPEGLVIESHTEWTKNHYQVRIRSFKQDSIMPNSIVMLGNSLTEQGGNWASRLNTENVSNRGIAGDNTEGVLARLGEIKCAKPKAIFLMIGTNDLWTNLTEEEVVVNIEKIGNDLATSLPETSVFVQTIMPVEEGHNQTGRLLRINNLLRSVEDSGYVLIDTFEEMSGSDNYLPASYTTDGVHLNSMGYDKWASILQPYVTNN